MFGKYAGKRYPVKNLSALPECASSRFAVARARVIGEGTTRAKAKWHEVAWIRRRRLTRIRIDSQYAE